MLNWKLYPSLFSSCLKKSLMIKSASVFLLLLCLGCGKPLPTLEGIDLAQWRKDKNACHAVREPMREAIDRQKEKLLGLDEEQMLDLLGRPDQNELYTRSQKFYYYYIEPAPACGSQGDTTSQRLVIRFNAVGLATEVTIE
jgi:hypothetical protein